MSKIFKPFILFFKLIYKIIDKLIVTPISRIIYKLGELSKANSGKLEKLLNRPNVLIYVSLVAAVILFLLVDSQVIKLTEKEAEFINDLKINVAYNSDYVVEGIPDGVDITLIGNKSTIYLATQLGQHEVILDLTKYGPGTHKVPLKYTNQVEAIEYKLDPSTVTVKISQKVPCNKLLSYDVVNLDKLDSKLSITNVDLMANNEKINDIIINSSKEKIDSVAVVKALIDATQIEIKESGKFTIDNITLVAYDNLGNKVSNVEFVPDKISAVITVDSYHASKSVKVIPTINKEDTSGNAISSITTSVKTVEVYGEKSVVDNIDFIEAEITLDSLAENKTISADLIKVPGIRYMSATKTNVNVTVGKAEERTISNVQVRSIGVGEKYVAGAEAGNSTIDVSIKGVKSVINGIKATDIRAEVDLSNLKEGKHTVPVKVYVTNEDSDKVQPTALTKEITVNISIK